MKKVEIYEFQLKEIQDALRLTANIYKCRKKKTCWDRTVTQAEQYANNALEEKIDKIVPYV